MWVLRINQHHCSRLGGSALKIHLIGMAQHGRLHSVWIAAVQATSRSNLHFIRAESLAFLFCEIWNALTVSHSQTPAGSSFPP